MLTTVSDSWSSREHRWALFSVRVLSSGWVCSVYFSFLNKAVLGWFSPRGGENVRGKLLGYWSFCITLSALKCSFLTKT